MAERPGLLRTLAAFLAHSGDSWFWWAGLGLLWWLGNSFWHPWALAVLLSIVALAVIVLAVKFTIRRRRPQGEWGGLYRKTDPHSFPSGHAATAFAFSSVIAHQYPKWWVKVLVYSAATSVAWSRLNDNVHFASDVLVGSAIGWYVGSTLTKFHQKKKSNITFGFEMSNGTPQLQLQLKF